MNECREQTYPDFYLHALTSIEQGALPVFNVDTDGDLRYSFLMTDEVLSAQLRQLSQRVYARELVKVLKTVYETQGESDGRSQAPT